jgi:hypothetical protein
LPKTYLFSALSARSSASETLTVIRIHERKTHHPIDVAIDGICSSWCWRPKFIGTSQKFKDKENSGYLLPQPPLQISDVYKLNYLLTYPIVSSGP